MNNESRLADVQSQLKIREFETERTQLVLEETTRNLKAAQTECEKLLKKQEVSALSECYIRMLYQNVKSVLYYIRMLYQHVMSACYIRILYQNTSQTVQLKSKICLIFVL